jgi:RNA polymerase sigma-70 factor (ECF subfamily)
MTEWETIVGQHAPQVWATAYRLLGDRTDAADCLQDTFLSALKVSRRSEVRNWGGLLNRLATARAVDRLRRRVRQTGREAPLPADGEMPGPGADPPQAAEDAEAAALLRDALGRIPAGQAEVFCLRYMSDLSNREIAQQVGMTSNAVGVLLYRARARLRELLSPSLLPET